VQSKRADIRIINSETLSDNWYNLKKYTFDLQRSDGDWQRQEREVYDRGNGATILLYNRASKTVILTRQFRFPVFINGHEEDLIEAAAGLLDNLDPESRIKAEAEEETGYKVTRIVARRNFSHRNALNYAPQQPSENPLLRTVQIKTPRIPEGKELAEKEAGEPILGDVE